ncbi:putative major facilitator superfamily [Medicago truncatula]|uniref:MFS transporter n=1 Tax=Medicago truncatula TaxID=3880 RepID=A0A072TTK7_MEDTR|nr:high affinity nitrate transporter 2.5 [Medicago truncatula]KEH20844.1 MFS transporter [Medicago truncatula]RHN42930.1 putative major facilitator superfamily [Medicago truncatula]
MMKPETVTLVLVNLAGIMERADESLLPGVYKEIGDELNADPTALGSLTLFRSLVQAFCYPLAAYLATRHNRAHVIALGAFLWAAATFLVAVSSTFLQVAISRAFNGIGLAIVIPAIQSLIADSTIDSNRGVAFGWLHLTGNLGSIIGSLFAVLLASTSIFGISGWRIAFHIVALVSVIVGILVRIFANDPHFPKDNKITTSYQTPNKSFYSEMKDLITEAKTVIKVPSFQIIVAQGVFGSFRGSSLSFFTLWLELIGFSHGTTAIIWTVFIISNSFGGLFGGWFGDFLSQRLPNTGRIMLAQISAGSTIPLAAILLLLLPNDPSTPFVHGLVLVILGLITFWCAPATNDPIFAEIVPEKSRAAIYALDRSFESTLASFAPPIVGVLAQHVYGYKPIPKGSSNSVKIIETDRENAASLAKALYSTIAIPIAVCVFIYSFLYFTYPRDKERARMVALVESEMEQLKVEGEEYYETHDNDEKVLLSR